MPRQAWATDLGRCDLVEAALAGQVLVELSLGSEPSSMGRKDVSVCENDVRLCTGARKAIGKPDVGVFTEAWAHSLEDEVDAVVVVEVAVHAQDVLMPATPTPSLTQGMQQRREVSLRTGFCLEIGVISALGRSTLS
jgi:hypothetical protein